MCRLTKEKILSAVREADLEELIPRLILYAHRRIKISRWQGSRVGKPPGGYEAEDFVYNAFSKLLSGKRKYPQGASLEAVLYGIISSEISNLSRSKENRITRCFDEILLGKVGPPVELAGEKESFVRLFSDDELVCKIVKYIVDLDDTRVLLDSHPNRIAENIGYDPSEIEKALKRLRRSLRREGFGEEE